MVKTRKSVQQIMEFPVDVTQSDIDGGICRLASLCMHKIAVARTLDKLDPKAGHHKVRVDAGQIKFNFGGWRYVAPTPKKAKRTLIMFDDPKSQARVSPHSYKVVAARSTKIIKITKDRQEQINEARRARVEGGEKPKPYTLRKRIIGFDLGHAG